LREAIRQTGAMAEILPSRVESLSSPPAGWPKRRVVVARALAPIDKFLDLARPLLGADALCIMLKGQNAEAEVAEARRHWSFRLDSAPSLSDPRGVILIMSELVSI
jgi:16S rRNA (guanine527-N7)-methyltransferase